MLLHIMYDEKVISRAIRLFEEALPGESKYIIMKKPSSPDYVNTDCPNVLHVRYNYNALIEAVGDVNSFSCIVIHFLVGYSVRLVNHITHPNIVWIAWGADLYGELLAYKGYRLYYNPHLIKEIENKGQSLYRFLYNKASGWKSYFEKRRAIQHITTFCGEEGDYKLLKHYYPTIDIRFHPFFYYPLEEIVDTFRKYSLGDNIIVGHCASIYDNHEEVLNELYSIDLGNRKIITPLGYGNALIRRHVVELGQRLFADRYVPIEVFLPLDEYNKVLYSARTYIYGNYRQEAFGNILVALYMGGAVFLHPSNVLLETFRQMGVILYSTEELTQKVNYQLTDEEKLNNKDIVSQKFNKKTLLRLIKGGFSTQER